VSRARDWANTARRRPRWKPGWVLTVAALIAAALWWQWPLIAGHDDRLDVLLISDAFLTANETPVTYRIHEDGRTLRWDSTAASWCTAAEEVSKIVGQFDPAVVVVSLADAAGCDQPALADVVRAAGGHTVLIVAQPGRSGIESAGAGATVIDPTRFVGDQLAATSMPCQWWETCTADGTIAVRNADGSLTPEGADRIARMIVGQLP
jgi:hypothetical protein